MFTNAVTALENQAQQIEAQIAQLHEQLSQVQSQIQAVKSVEQAAESAVAQVQQALSGIRAIDPTLESQFQEQVEACFSGKEVNLLKAAIDYDETDGDEPESPIDPDIEIAKIVGEVEPETPQEEPEILPDLRAWKLTELKEVVTNLGGTIPKKATKTDLICEIGRLRAREGVSIAKIKEALGMAAEF